MEKLNKCLVLLLIAVCSAYTLDGFAQNDNPIEKEIVVITKMVDNNGNETVEKKTFVSNELQFIDMDQMIEMEVTELHGTPFLGIVVENNPNGKGVVIVSIADDSPAAKGDLAVGDVIISFGEQHVGNKQDFELGLSSQPLTTDVLLWRAGERIFKKVTMEPAELIVEKKEVKKSQTAPVAKSSIAKNAVKQKTQAIKGN